MVELKIRVHEIATDGLPDMDKCVGRVGFIFDGCIVSGWPLNPTEHADLYTRLGATSDEGVLWEANSDVGHHKPFFGVTHWVEFSMMLKIIEMNGKDADGRVYGEF